MATVADNGPSAAKYAERPLSKPFRVEMRPVHEAASTGNADIIETVLRYGGDAASIDGFYRTTLHILAMSSNDAGSADVLLAYGADSALEHRTQIDGLNAFGHPSPTVTSLWRTGSCCTHS
jgi:hypothetical protein